MSPYATKTKRIQSNQWQLHVGMKHSVAQSSTHAIPERLVIKMLHHENKFFFACYF